jgi:nicotinamidase-related amidase
VRILRGEAAALIIDVQERLFPHMQERDALESRLLTLVRGLQLLEVPLLVTQQYTKGLGETIPSILAALGWEPAPNASGAKEAGDKKVPAGTAASPVDPTASPARPATTPVSALRPPYLEKRAFSCCDEADFGAALAALNRSRVIVAGIEAHVCVLQTVVDLLAGGYTPVVVADCVSSRRAIDRDIALRRLQGAGAVLTTCESILFELTRTSTADIFRAISALVK